MATLDPWGWYRPFLEFVAGQYHLRSTFLPRPPALEPDIAAAAKRVGMPPGFGDWLSRADGGKFPMEILSADALVRGDDGAVLVATWGASMAFWAMSDGQVESRSQTKAGQRIERFPSMEAVLLLYAWRRVTDEFDLEGVLRGRGARQISEGELNFEAWAGDPDLSWLPDAISELKWKVGSPASPDAISAAEVALGTALPSPWRSVLAVMDGAHGKGLRLWPLSRIVKEWQARRSETGDRWGHAPWPSRIALGNPPPFEADEWHLVVDPPREGTVTVWDPEIGYRDAPTPAAPDVEALITRVAWEHLRDKRRSATRERLAALLAARGVGNLDGTDPVDWSRWQG